MIMARKTKITMTQVKAGGLLLALAGLILFNIYTNIDTLNALLGVTFGTAAFAIAVSLVDLFGLSKVITKEDSWENEPVWVYVATGIWGLAVIVDIGFTAIWVAMRLAPVAPPTNFPEWEMLMRLFPWIFSATEALIRIGLVLTLAYAGEKIVHRRKTQPSLHVPPSSTRKPTHARTDRERRPTP
jgi:hypothetical protein